jgi:hypothetical protein
MAAGSSQRRRIKSMLTTVDNGIDRALLGMYFDVGWINSFDADGPLCGLFFKSESAIGDAFAQQLIALPINTIKRNVEGLSNS